MIQYLCTKFLKSRGYLVQPPYLITRAGLNQKIDGVLEDYEKQAKKNKRKKFGLFFGNKLRSLK